MDVKAELVQIGARLKDARERAGLEPAEVCALLEEMDPWLAMSPKTLGNWEAGRNMPCMLQFRALCTIYGVMGYRILYGRVPLEFTRSEASELVALARGASEGARRKLDIVLSLVRARDEAEA